jgi:hypothetical protein
MNEKGPLEREIAEDYWRQRQAAQATQSGFETIGGDSFFRWLDANEVRLKAIAEQNGSPGEAAREAVESYRRSISSTTSKHPLMTRTPT